MPGSYRIGSFLEDLQQKPSSYHFRDSSRGKMASHQKFERTGAALLPGAYESEDFVLKAAKRQVTFGFKATDREQGPKIGHGYGDKVQRNPLLVCYPSTFQHEQIRRTSPQ